MGRPAPPSRDLPSRRLRRRFPEQKLFRAASVRESIRSECPVRRPCTPPGYRNLVRYSSEHFCLRDSSSMPALCRRYYGSTGLPRHDLSPHLPHRVAEADTQNGLTGILQDVDYLARRCFQIKTLAI